MNSNRMFIVIFFCGLIGIALAAILNILYVQGILIDEYIGGSITIANLMSITIVIWVLIGVVIGSSK